MRTLPTIALTLLLALFATAAGAPAHLDPSTVTFTGRVLDSVTAAPLRGASVVLRGSSHGSLTDANGTYRLVVPRAGFSGGEAILDVAVLGYRHAEIRVTTERDTVYRDIRLQMAEIQLEGIIATAASAGAMQFRPRAANPRELRRPADPRANTEGYAHIEENDFAPARENPLSTFSIDVDRASYGNVRRFILDGELPPADAVRIEEMVNYFPYDYPEPAPGEPFSISTEITDAPWNPGHRLMRIGLRSAAMEDAALPPGNLVFLLDVSGSMDAELPVVKESLRLLVQALREEDRVAIVVYAGAAGLVLPSTSGEQKTRIIDAIERLEAGGSTAGGEGLHLAYDVARQNFIRGGINRVILATDGDFNVGPSSDAEMIRLVERRRDEGTFLTVLGFGTGNLQDAKMEQIADHGNGNFAYIDGLLEARKVLVSELGGTLLTVAKDVKIQVEFNPSRVAAYRLIGYENRALDDEDFADDRKDAGELGAGHSVTALYEVIPVGARSSAAVGGVDPLRYQGSPTLSSRSAGGELAFVKVRYKEREEEISRLLERPVADRRAEASADASFAAAVAGFGMVLRDSKDRGGLGAPQVLELARRGRGADPHGYRADFIRLVEAFQRLEDAQAADPGTR